MTERQKDGFDSLGLIDQLAKAVSALGYEEPTPVQRETIPLLLAKRDVLGQAATGTGKTAAFALPMLQRLVEDEAAKKQTCGLVLVPTRELAMQVSEAIHKYAKGLGVTVLPVYGGAPISQQIRTLERGAGIVVATPGRALDHIKRGTLKLGALRMLVLDEADEMLDMGFAEDLDAILEATPKTRQTALFSATMPARILSIAQRHLNNPARVIVAREKTAAGKMPRVRQIAYIVPRAHKPAALDRVLDMENPTSAIVFCRTRLEVETLVETLNAHGRRAQALHGGMEQRQRDRVMQMFRGGKGGPAHRHRRRGARPRHRAAVARLQLRRAAGGRGVRAPHRPHRPRGPRRHRDHARRAARAPDAAQHRELHQAEDRHPDRADGRRAAHQAARRHQASIRELILAGDLDDVRVVVDTLAQEFDIVAIASAAVKLAHRAEAGDEAERDIPTVVAHERPAQRGFRPDREERGPAREPRTPQRFSKGAIVGPAGPREKRRERPLRPRRSRCCLSAPDGRRASGPAIWSARSPEKPGSIPASSARFRSPIASRWSRSRSRAPRRSSPRCGRRRSAAARSRCRRDRDTSR